jgi:hypothetical protein
LGVLSYCSPWMAQLVLLFDFLVHLVRLFFVFFAVRRLVASVLGTPVLSRKWFVLFSIPGCCFGSFGSRHRLTYPLTWASRGWASEFRCLVLGLLVGNIQVHFGAGLLGFSGCHFRCWFCMGWVVAGYWTVMFAGHVLLSRLVRFPMMFEVWAWAPMARWKGQSWIGEPGVGDWRGLEVDGFLQIVRNRSWYPAGVGGWDVRPPR